MNTKVYLDTLFEFLKIPTISSIPEYANDMVVGAQFLETQLETLGFDVSFHWPKGKETTPPIVVGQRIDNPDNPTILVYGHYDVQPPDPVDAWKSDPFEPTIRNNQIVARGASDDKGQIMTHLAAFDQLGQHWGKNWPINIKVVFEGQEEQGSPGMQEWLKEEEAQNVLSSDVALICDTPMVVENTPTVIYGLRGILYFVIKVQVATESMHSGQFGGVILNPANALSYILSQLLDVTTGKVLVPGFYDDVVYTQHDKDQLKKIPFDEQQFLKEAQHAKSLWGNKEFTPKERLTIQPSLDINGLWSGNTTFATNTTIPSVAYAKVSCRTVPNQDPAQLGQLLTDYIQKITPHEVDVTVTITETGDGLLTDINSDDMKIVTSELEKTFEKSTIFDRDGASIPAVAAMQKYLHLDPILFGYSLQEDYHVPNEKFALEAFEKGITTNMNIYKAFAQKKK